MNGQNTAAGPAAVEVLVQEEAARPRYESRGRERRSSSVPLDLRRQRSASSSLVQPLPLGVQLPPVQLPVSGRTLGRHVSLGPGWELNKEGVAQQQQQYSDEPSTSQAAAAASPPAEVPPQYQGPGVQERVRCHAVADSFDRYALQDAVLRREGSLQAYAEVLISDFHRVGDSSTSSVFYFDFGVVVFWQLSKEIEQYILREVAQSCMVAPLLPAQRETDRMRVQYTSAPKHHIENDLLALHYRFADDPQVKLAISFALAQSTKLSLLEERTRALGRQLSRLPVAMAQTGDIPVSERQIMKHVGDLFLVQQAVNLLGKVLDTPDSITAAPDHIGSLYKSVAEYLEIHGRVQLLNDRFSVMQELLDILRSHAQKSYYSQLEAAVMWLVGLCAVVAVFQLVFLSFWKPAWRAS
ncbi:Sporulation RMD1 isoform B [Chlorella sorokiniana]|uniref:Sporulation RMD1 isoform B n=1 Tax=Chlorella sorokiniana TaxID=3076 RepID=A0A2P6TX34_CHLSO|nr:Sporulation RMD1 isoform B [Chlorella sorokiniana]|eukprot:PRW58617.1 Sporulation RMD1 isoform B [Chlorella sorokiniana]